MREGSHALVVFRSEEEAERYRSQTGKYPEEEGFNAVTLGHEDLANVLSWHECSHVGMPEPWTGDNGVDLFKASDFIGMLEESLPA